MTRKYSRRKITRVKERQFGKNLGHYIYRSPNGGYQFMRSTWEVKYANFLDQKGIKWTYEPMAFKTSEGFYFPDFYLPGEACWVEIKGRLTDEAAKKMENFQKSYPNEKLTILRGNDLKDLGIDI